MVGTNFATVGAVCMSRSLIVLSWLLTTAVIGGVFVYWARRPELTQMQLFLSAWPWILGGLAVDTVLLLAAVWCEHKEEKDRQ